MSDPVSSIDTLFANTYDELRVAAHRARALSRSDALNTTLLVHELSLRLRQSSGAEFALKAQFFAYAGRALRSIMVDHARSRIAERARIQEIAPAEAIDIDPEALSPDQALALDAALRALEVEDTRAATVVELRFFAGLSLLEIAEQLQLTTRTIDRDCRFARAFLQTAMAESAGQA